MVAQEYYALPPVEQFTELIDGEVVVNQPKLPHQRIVGDLYYSLTTWARAVPGRGEAGVSVDVELDAHNVYAPDVWWTAEDHRPERDAARIEGPPDLAVEVRSPSTWRFDVGVKKATYERAGLAELWLVDTEASTVLVFRRSSSAVAGFDLSMELSVGQVLTSPLLAGFSLAVEKVFESI